VLQKTLTAFCDECATTQPLVSQTLKEAALELSSHLWTTEGKSHYCNTCSAQRVHQAAQNIQQ
jgi:hypothetical protein